MVARYLTVNMSEASLIVSASMLDNWFIVQVLEIKLFMTQVVAINSESRGGEQLFLMPWLLLRPVRRKRT